MGFGCGSQFLNTLKKVFWEFFLRMFAEFLRVFWKFLGVSCRVYSCRFFMMVSSIENKQSFFRVYELFTEIKKPNKKPNFKNPWRPVKNLSTAINEHFTWKNLLFSDLNMMIRRKNVLLILTFLYMLISLFDIWDFTSEFFFQIFRFELKNPFRLL
jgi:hypothetical protein